MEIQIKKFLKKYQKQVEVMVFEGLIDTAKDQNQIVKEAIKNYLDRSLNEDLGDIEKNYMNDGIFFVALDMSTNRVVGSLGAEYIDGSEYRLKRLSVKISHRSKGIAKNLLKNIESWVLESKGSSLILGTSEIQKNAFKFWTSNGFDVEKTNLSENGFKIYSLKKIIKP
tara:strand:- start:386 stop:892 length:507 start_codon:yes stop_codon:yes gene_type:complete